MLMLLLLLWYDDDPVCYSLFLYTGYCTKHVGLQLELAPLPLRRHVPKGNLVPRELRVSYIPGVTYSSGPSIHSTGIHAPDNNTGTTYSGNRHYIQRQQALHTATTGTTPNTARTDACYDIEVLSFFFFFFPGFPQFTGALYFTQTFGFGVKLRVLPDE